MVGTLLWVFGRTWVYCRIWVFGRIWDYSGIWDYSRIWVYSRFARQGVKLLSPPVLASTVNCRSRPPVRHPP